MKAFVFTEKGKIGLRELPEPECDPRGAVLEPVALSPCSSDVHTVFAGNGPRRADLVLGHEGVGRIVRVGSEVRELAPGDLVIVSAVMPDVPGGTGHENGNFSGTKLGRNINGMWSERFYVPEAEQNLLRVPKGMPMETALMCADILPTGATAVREAGIDGGMTVVVLGTGAVGLAAAAFAAEKGAGVIAVGSPDRKRCTELAMEAGAMLCLSYRDGAVLAAREEEAVLSAETIGHFRKLRSPLSNSGASPVVDYVLALTENVGADRCLICGGGAKALPSACDLVRYGSGRVVNVAYFEGGGSVELPVFSLGRGMAGKTFSFVLSGGGHCMLEEMLRRSEAFAGRGFDAGRLVTHKLKGFDTIPEALELMRRGGEVIKVMVEV